MEMRTGLRALSTLERLLLSRLMHAVQTTPQSMLKMLWSWCDLILSLHAFGKLHHHSL